MLKKAGRDRPGDRLGTDSDRTVKDSFGPPQDRDTVTLSGPGFYDVNEVLAPALRLFEEMKFSKMYMGDCGFQSCSCLPFKSLGPRALKLSTCCGKLTHRKSAA